MPSGEGGLQRRAKAQPLHDAVHPATHSMALAVSIQFMTRWQSVLQLLRQIPK